MPMTGISS
jgi:long-chain-fatty-acid--CoA ligase ACSBG